MKYALLDWDNTIRNGYTLFSLIDYFVENKIITPNIKTQVDFYFSEYRSGNMSHDCLAEKACNVFAASLCGLREETINNAIVQFVEKDKKQLFSFSSTIFSVLRQHNILPIIVSGAPTTVIKQYRRFQIHTIYGFSMETKDGIYTGEVLSNYGYNKKLIASKIIAQMQRPPEIAFGDSLSDYDMLTMSKKSVIIGTSIKDAAFTTDGIIPVHSSNAYVRKLISKLLSESVAKKETAFG